MDIWTFNADDDDDDELILDSDSGVQQDFCSQSTLFRRTAPPVLGMLMKSYC